MTHTHPTPMAGRRQLSLRPAENTQRGRRWIDKEIERLDPEVDYARIWELTAAYKVDETFFNLLYCLGLPRITQNPAGSELLARRTRKASERMHERADDTLSNFWIWYTQGPNGIDAERSLEQVNRIHAALAKTMPDAFPDEDYIYTVCMLATTAHNVLKKAGHPGFTDKQKIAAHHYWRAILRKMRGLNGYIDDFPEDFAAMERLVVDFDSREFPQTDAGTELAEYTVQQFCQRNFPKPLQGFGRQMVLTFQEPHIRALRKMGDPNPVAAFFIRKLVYFKVWMADHVLPDPKLNLVERAKAAGRNDGQMKTPRMVSATEVPFARDGRVLDVKPGTQPKSSGGCPFH